MYPTLYRVLDRGYITSYTADGEKRKLRIYYQITPAGRDHLKAFMNTYHEAHAGYQSVLSTTIQQVRPPLECSGLFLTEV